MDIRSTITTTRNLQLEQLSCVTEIDLVAMGVVRQMSDRMLHFDSTWPRRSVDVGDIQRREKWIVGAKHNAICAH